MFDGRRRENEARLKVAASRQTDADVVLDRRLVTTTDAPAAAAAAAGARCYDNRVTDATSYIAIKSVTRVFGREEATSLIVGGIGVHGPGGLGL